MPTRILLLGLTLTFAAATAQAQVTIVDEDFESYTDTADFLTTWPVIGTGTGGAVVTTDTVFYPGIEGQAIEVDTTLGSNTANQLTTPFSTVPTSTTSVRYGGDIFVDNTSSNLNHTIGLRSSGSGAANILEVGFFNQLAGGVFAYRNILFPGSTNWNLFSLPETLDSLFEIDSGVGGDWHRFEVEVTLTDVTFTVDLYRDGVTNDPLNPVPGVGTPGVDATDVVAGATVNIAAPFDDLRFGVASASASPPGNFVAVDNIFLEEALLSGGGLNADLDGDNDVDVADALAIQRAGGAFGDWDTEFGTGSAVVAVGAVPEPGTAALLMLSAGMMLGVRRR